MSTRFGLAFTETTGKGVTTFLAHANNMNVPISHLTNGLFPPGEDDNGLYAQNNCHLVLSGTSTTTTTTTTTTEASNSTNASNETTITATPTTPPAAATLLCKTGGYWTTLPFKGYQSSALYTTDVCPETAGDSEYL